MSPINLNGASGVSSMDISGMDIETAMMAVQSTRAQLLESQMNEQLKGVQDRNNQIASMNESLNGMRMELATNTNTISSNEVQIAHLNELKAKLEQTVDRAGGKNSSNYIGLSNNAIDNDDAKASIEIANELKSLGMLSDSLIEDVDKNGTQDARAMDIASTFSKIDEKLKELGSKNTELKETNTKLQTRIDNAKTDIDTLSNSQQMEMLRLQSLSNKRNEAFDLMTNFVKKMQDSRSSIVGNMR